jgi:iron complex transport system permease protein
LPLIVTQSRVALACAIGAAALLLLALASLAVGSFPLAPVEVFRVLTDAFSGSDAPADATARAVLVELRAPRIVATLAIGAALAMAGAAFQNAFRNPLVSPDILGISSGCALGAVIAILAGWSAASMQAAAFAGGVTAGALVVAIASRVRAHDRVLTLVLVGVVVGSLFASGVAFVKTIADPYNQLPPITFWLLGSFAGITPADIAFALPLILIGTAPVALLRWRVDLLALPDDEARALGADVGRLRLAILAGATLATSAGVAVAGVIGWIGLVVPHLARLLCGASFARVLPVSGLLGAAILLVVDTLCRVVAAGELPPGVVTALVGTPAFVLLLAVSARRA